MSNYATKVAISSITQAAGVATATVVDTSVLATGEVLQILGARQSAYNGPHSITVASGTTFTYLVPSTTVTPATIDMTGGALSYRQAVLPYIPTVGGSGAPYVVKYASTAYEKSAIIKASSGVLYSLTVYNSGGTQFIQIHDSATVPAANAVPKRVITVNAVDNGYIDIPGGEYYLNGIVAVNSSTGPTYTAGGNDCWFNANFTT